MDELIDFMRQALDDDESMARTATTVRQWEAASGTFGPTVRVGNGDLDDRGPEWSRTVNYAVWTCEDDDEDCPAEAASWMAEAEHIARWDPARVLAEVEAKRRILDLHEQAVPDGHDQQGYRFACEHCSQTTPCPTLCLLAQPYAGRDGWREEWRA